ncbi:MAG: DUF1553 domain-containing protein, partial [Verrucomicrobiota bacterium]
HKFDPISQADYYRMYATFAGIRHGRAVLASPEEKQRDRQEREPIDARLNAAEEAKASLEKSILARAVSKKETYSAQWTRPPVNRTGTEERFESVEVKWVRLICESGDTNPRRKTFNIDEFEIWSAGATPINVALATQGAEATGKARINEDFPGVYGPQLAIDGRFGRRFIAASDTLTIALKEPTRVNRIFFSSARGAGTPDRGEFAFVGDYRIEGSLDGENWFVIAHGQDRKPANDAHRDHRLLKQETTKEERDEKRRLNREIASSRKALGQLPALPQVWVGKRNPEDASGPFHLFIGGSPQRKGEKVVPASLSTLSEVTSAYTLSEKTPESKRRLALAEWITSPINPLTPRVLANRLWQYHFGTGLVDTPNDFGFMGGRPTHPELLDFLASKLVENGWRLKPMHRLIMQSRAYQQSSVWRANGAAKDGDSRWLWRFPPRRLSAEEIRDTVLAISDQLELKMGGPGFRLYHYMQDNVSTYRPLDQHGPETYRRAIYHQNARASVVDLMTEFDQPDCAFSAPRRARTTTPLQALTMLNHSFTVDMAEALQRRLGEAPPEEQVERLFRYAYQRLPNDEERNRLSEAINEIGLRGVCRAILNSSELIYLD